MDSFLNLIFSDDYDIAEYSETGKYLLLSFENKLKVICTNETIPVVLREVESGCKIKTVAFSRDETHVLYSVYSENTVTAFSLGSKKWICKIDTGTDDVEQAVWSPSGRHIITFSPISSKATVWSLEGFPITYIKNGYVIGNSCFSASGLFYAVPALQSTSVLIYETENWKIISEIICEEHIQNTPVWNPIHDCFALFNNHNLNRCYAVILSAKDNKIIGKFERGRENRVECVRLIQWSPSGQLLAIACFDSCIYIIEHLLWTTIIKFELARHLFVTDTKVFKIWNGEYAEMGYRPINFVVSTNLNVSSFRSQLNQISFNHQTSRLASVFECAPALVWIWNLKELTLMTVIVLQSAATDLQWRNSSMLTVCHNYEGFTIFDNGVPKNVLLGEVPENVVSSLKWDKLGTYLILKGKSKMCGYKFSLSI